MTPSTSTTWPSFGAASTLASGTAFPSFGRGAPRVITSPGFSREDAVEVWACAS